jgi:hypothetical protein
MMMMSDDGEKKRDKKWGNGTAFILMIQLHLLLRE